MRSFAAGIRKRAVSTRFPIRQRAPSTTRLMRSGRFWRLPASARIILWIAPSTQPRSFASGLPECFWRTPPGSCKSTASRSASNMASQRIGFGFRCAVPAKSLLCGRAQRPHWAGGSGAGFCYEMAAGAGLGAPSSCHWWIIWFRSIEMRGRASWLSRWAAQAGGIVRWCLPSC